jgi:hypothetical protein
VPIGRPPLSEARFNSLRRDNPEKPKDSYARRPRSLPIGSPLSDAVFKVVCLFFRAFAEENARPEQLLSICFQFGLFGFVCFFRVLENFVVENARPELERVYILNTK